MPIIKKTAPTTPIGGGRTLKPSTQQSQSQKGSTSSNGSLLSRAIDVSEIQDQFIKMVVYGINRVGKTTLACQWPKPLLLVGLEPANTGGALSVTTIPRVKAIKIDSKENALNLAVELRNDTYYKTVVLDSVTSLQDIILKEIVGAPDIIDQINWGMVGEDQYRERSEVCREVLRKYINLPKHIVFNAKERDHNANKGDRKPKMLRQEGMESFFAADLGGATAGWLHDVCDYVGRLYIDKEYKRVVIPGAMMNGKKGEDRVEEHETGKTIRRLRTLLHPNYAAGLRSAAPEQVPEFIDVPMAKAGTSPTFDLMLKIIKGEYNGR